MTFSDSQKQHGINVMLASMNHRTSVLQMWRDYFKIFNITATDAQWLIKPVLDFTYVDGCHTGRTAFSHCLSIFIMLTLFVTKYNHHIDHKSYH